VISELKTWDNKKLIFEALREIIDVHERYKNFAEKTRSEAEEYIKKYFR